MAPSIDLSSTNREASFGGSASDDLAAPALSRLLGALLHVSGSIDDLQVRDAPEGQQCRPRSFAIGAPDLEQGNVVIDLGVLEQPFAGCETAALLKNLQVPDMIARRNP
jgi:hypothetical protein